MLQLAAAARPPSRSEQVAIWHWTCTTVSTATAGRPLLPSAPTAGRKMRKVQLSRNGQRVVTATGPFREWSASGADPQRATISNEVPDCGLVTFQAA